MSKHLDAKLGEIAETVLLPGDPLRAENLAKTYLKNPKCYNKTRNMLGFTGTDEYGNEISIQGSGMGMASLGIYVHELINDYGVKTIIRVGTAGALHEELNTGDVVIATSACSDSGKQLQRFRPGLLYAPSASPDLLLRAQTDTHDRRELRKRQGYQLKFGVVFSSDNFYEGIEDLKVLQEYGVLAVEMETAELYTLAAKYRIKALSILTISDHVFPGLETKEKVTMPNHERELGGAAMATIAFSVAHLNKNM